MGHSANFKSNNKLREVDFLGWGSFSLIYKCQGQNLHEEISRYAFEKEVLHNEKQVLADLKTCSHVVQLQDSNDVEIKIGSVFEKVPSLTLTPLGLKINFYLLKFQ